MIKQITLLPPKIRSSLAGELGIYDA